MKTFADRLKVALEKMGISQAEAARRCSVSQQSINYIISNNLKQSKLAANIAFSLNINPDWLIYGEGKFKETHYYELPLLETGYQILKYIHNDLDEETISFFPIDKYLGDVVFGYLNQPNKLAICCLKEYNFEPIEYLCISGTSVQFRSKPSECSFSVVEWRIRSGNFPFS